MNYKFYECEWDNTIEAFAGHVFNEGGVWFGIHHPGDYNPGYPVFHPKCYPKKWVLVDLITGIRLNGRGTRGEFKTIKQAKNQAKIWAKIIKRDTSSSYNEERNKAVKQAYIDDDNPLMLILYPDEPQEYYFYISDDQNNLNLVKGKVFERDGVFFGIDRWIDHTLNKTLYTVTELTTGHAVNVGSYDNEKEAEKDLTATRIKIVKSYLKGLTDKDPYYKNIAIIKKAYIEDENPLKNILYKGVN